MFALEQRSPIPWSAQAGQVWSKTILGLNMTVDDFGAISVGWPTLENSCGL